VFKDVTVAAGILLEQRALQSLASVYVLSGIPSWHVGLRDITCLLPSNESFDPLVYLVDPRACIWPLESKACLRVGAC
jgi:hypothetical protein